MTVLRFIQNDPEQCIPQEFALWLNSATATSSLVRLAKGEVQRLAGAVWSFIKFNITMPGSSMSQRYRLHEAFSRKKR